MTSLGHWQTGVPVGCEGPCGKRASGPGCAVGTISVTSATGIGVHCRAGDAADVLV